MTIYWETYTAKWFMPHLPPWKRNRVRKLGGYLCRSRGSPYARYCTRNYSLKMGPYKDANGNAKFLHRHERKSK